MYLGQNEWAHINCCIWSAEVYENNGALHQVHTAVYRGRHLVCRKNTDWLPQRERESHIFVVIAERIPHY